MQPSVTPSDGELLQLLHAVKADHPEYGQLRVISAAHASQSTWIFSESRCKKLLKGNGSARAVTAVDTAHSGAAIGTGRSIGSSVIITDDSRSVVDGPTADVTVPGDVTVPVRMCWLCLHVFAVACCRCRWICVLIGLFDHSSSTRACMCMHVFIVAYAVIGGCAGWRLGYCCDRYFTVVVQRCCGPSK